MQFALQLLLNRCCCFLTKTVSLCPNSSVQSNLICLSASLQPLTATMHPTFLSDIIIRSLFKRLRWFWTGARGAVIPAEQVVAHNVLCCCRKHACLCASESVDTQS